MVGVTARGVCRSVGAVAADGEDGGSGNIGDALTGCEGQLLIPSAEALSGQMNDGLAAGDESKGLAVSGMTFQNIREEAPGLPRFTGEPVRQIDRGPSGKPVHNQALPRHSRQRHRAPGPSR